AAPLIGARRQFAWGVEVMTSGKDGAPNSYAMWFRRGLAACALTIVTACTSTTEYLDASNPMSKVSDADLSARRPSGGGFLSGPGFGQKHNSQQGGVYYGYQQPLTTGERKSLER